MSKKTKAEQALPEMQVMYKLGCLRGSTGAVRIMRPMRGEAAVDVINTFTSELSDRELATIQTLSVDSVNIELELKLAEVCPNFECLILGLQAH